MTAKDIEEYKKTFSNEQLREIVKEYDEGEKIKNIILKFNIKISPGQMSRFLPPVITEKQCPYCGELMVRPRTRDPYSCEDQIRCQNCGHKMSNRRKCKNCLMEMERREQAKQQIIHNYYSARLPIKKRKTDELNLEEQYYLYMLYVSEGIYANLDTIACNYRRNKTETEIIKKLYDLKVISVSPDSDINAFSSEEFPSRFYINRVNYIVNECKASNQP